MKNSIKNISLYITLFIYYTFARYLPNLPICNLAKISRRFYANLFFENVGKIQI